MFNRREKNRSKCDSCYGYHHNGNDHSYIYPVKWQDFISGHNKYIDHALALREKMDDDFVITRELL